MLYFEGSYRKPSLHILPYGDVNFPKKAPKVDRFIYITCKKKIICAWLILGVVLIEVCRRTPPRQSAQNEPPVRLALVYPAGFNFVLARQLSS